MPLPQELDVVLFQTARELLVNVAKVMRKPGECVSGVESRDAFRATQSSEDDGIGFDASGNRWNSCKKALGFAAVYTVCATGLDSLVERLHLNPGRGAAPVLP